MSEQKPTPQDEIVKRIIASETKPAAPTHPSAPAPSGHESAGSVQDQIVRRILGPAAPAPKTSPAGKAQ